MTPELRRQAQLQLSAFSWEQAVELGDGPHWVEAGVRRGDLVKPLPRVYLPATVRQTEPVLLQAALLWAGPEAAAARASAAFRWGLQRQPPREVTIKVPSTQRGGSTPSWLTVVRSKVVAATILHGTRVITLAHTVIDLAEVLDERELHAVLLQQVQAERTTIDEITAALEIVGRRRGSAVLRRLISEYDPGFESLLTWELQELARRAGIDEAEVGLEVTLSTGVKVHPDVGVLRLRWDLEADGWAFHSTRRQRESDHRRDRSMSAEDWQTDRFSTDAIRREGRATTRELGRLALARERALKQRAA